MNKVRQGLKSIADKLLIEFAKSLVDQGHKATGTLISSFESKFVLSEDKSELQILFEDYGIFLDRGRRKGVRKVPISALIDWIQTKGIASGDKEVRSMAFAIQTKIFKEGIPTKGSLRFSKTGKRVGWFSSVLDKEEENIQGILTDLAGEDVQITLDNKVTEINQNISKNPVIIPL